MAGNNFGNTGVRNTGLTFGKPTRMFLVRTVADDGTPNTIDLTTTGTKVDQTFLDTRQRELDASKRWFDIGKLENVAIVKADNVTFESGGGTVFQIRDGIQTVAFMLMKQDVKLLKAFVQVKCGSASDFSVFMVDDCDNILVEELTTDIGSPLKIAAGTFTSDWIFANETDPNMISFSWNIDQVVDVEKWDTINGDEVVTANIQSPLSIFAATGLEDSNVTVTTTTGTADIFFDQGGLGKGNKERVTGLVVADFSLKQISPTAAVATLSSVTENPSGSGKYEFLWVVENPGDVLQVDPLQPMLNKDVETRPFIFTIP